MRAYDHDAVTAALFPAGCGATLQRTSSDRPIDVPLAAGDVVSAYWSGRHSGAPALVVFGPGDQTISDQLATWPRWADEADVNLMLIDYPGQGSSPGSASLSAALDAAVSTLRYLIERPMGEVPSIVLVGRGLVGATLAAVAGREVGAGRLRTLVLECVSVDVSAQVAALLAPDADGPDGDQLASDLRADFDVVRSVTELRLPTLVLQPAFNAAAPASDAERLADAAAAEVVYFDHAEHVTIAEAQPEEYCAELTRWIEAHGAPSDEPERG